MLQKIKTLLAISDNSKDDLLEVLSAVATEEVKAYCNIEDVSKMESIIIQLVIIKYNRLGAEGLSTENYNGASFSYESEYPPQILAVLNKNRRCKFL